MSGPSGSCLHTDGKGRTNSLIPEQFPPDPCSGSFFSPKPQICDVRPPFKNPAASEILCISDVI